MLCQLKPGTHWRQSWIQHGRLCWKSTKSTVSLWPRTHWRQSRPYRQQSRPRQAVEFKLLPMCCQNRQQRRPYRQQSTLLPICRRFRQKSNSTLSPVCTGLNSLTHSLLRLTSEGRSDLHNERSCADDHSESIIVHPWSSSTGCIQVFLGRPGGRFQSGAGHLPCDRLTQCWRILWAGTSGGRRQTCPSNECLLSAMMKGRSVSFVWLQRDARFFHAYPG